MTTREALDCPECAAQSENAERRATMTTREITLAEAMAMPNFDGRKLLWSCYDDAEELSTSDPEEAIAEYLDQRPLPVEGEAIILTGYVPERLPENPIHFDPLTSVLEQLDEEWGNPEGSTEPTQEMLDAEKAFLATVFKEYAVWRHEPVVKAKVDALAWVREYHPEWLTEAGR